MDTRTCSISAIKHQWRGGQKLRGAFFSGNISKHGKRRVSFKANSWQGKSELQCMRLNTKSQCSILELHMGRNVCSLSKKTNFLVRISCRAVWRCTSSFCCARESWQRLKSNAISSTSVPNANKSKAYHGSESRQVPAELVWPASVGLKDIDIGVGLIPTWVNSARLKQTKLAKHLEVVIWLQASKSFNTLQRPEMLLSPAQNQGFRIPCVFFCCHCLPTSFTWDPSGKVKSAACPSSKLRLVVTTPKWLGEKWPNHSSCGRLCVFPKIVVGTVNHPFWGTLFTRNPHIVGIFPLDPARSCFWKLSWTANSCHTHQCRYGILRYYGRNKYQHEEVDKTRHRFERYKSKNGTHKDTCSNDFHQASVPKRNSSTDPWRHHHQHVLYWLVLYWLARRQ